MSKINYYKIVLVFLLHHVLVKSQNLVPNGNFETYSICPNNISQINYATGWINADSRTSPDYFNSCDSGANIPDTFFGYQQEGFGGKGFAGIYAFNIAVPNDGRDYIQTKLIDTLKPGKKYLASMYVNACDLYNYSIATLGMYFTSTAIQGPSTVGFMNVPNPQIKNTTLLSDTVNWILVQDTVTAIGNEAYLTIGNFSYDSLSDTVRVYHMGFGHNNDNAYYYIDNVSVVDVATIGVNEIKKNEVDINVFPNPNNGNFTLQHNLKEKAVLEITDISGKLVGKYNLPASSSKMQVENGQVENGIYLYRIISNNGILKAGKIVVMK